MFIRVMERWLFTLDAGMLTAPGRQVLLGNMVWRVDDGFCVVPAFQSCRFGCRGDYVLIRKIDFLDLNTSDSLFLCFRFAFLGGWDSLTSTNVLRYCIFPVYKYTHMNAAIRTMTDRVTRSKRYLIVSRARKRRSWKGDCAQHCVGRCPLSLPSLIILLSSDIAQR